MQNYEELMKKSEVDVSGSGLRLYYLHPEDRSKYISFPVERMSVRPFNGIVQPGRAQRSITFDQGMSIQFKEARFIPLLTDEAAEFFARYGLTECFSEYYIGIFTEDNDYAKQIMLPEYYSEWDGEETGELEIWSWYARADNEGEKLPPYGRYDDET